MSADDTSRWWDIGRGFDSTVRRFLADLRRYQLDAPPPDREIHPFDREHGVDTSGLLYADKLITGHSHDAASEGYYATAPSLFHGALARWQQTLGESLSPLVPKSLSDYTFFDLGCGKGRALLMASDYPFRKVMGVELSPTLANVARRNLYRWLSTPRACPRVSVMAGDVMQLRLPAGPVVLFLFNSFGAGLMTELLEGLVAAARVGTTPIDLIYVHPEHDLLVRRFASVLADEEVGFSPEDAAADAFDVSHDRVVVYRLR